MSTRANVIIQDGSTKLYFYRHSDGYPEGALPSLELFMSWIESGLVRNNASQAAGWLIMIGASEYAPDENGEKNYKLDGSRLTIPWKPNRADSYSGWKVGSYEPTDGLHFDVEFVYVINLQAKTLETYKAVEYEEFRDLAFED